MFGILKLNRFVILTLLVVGGLYGIRWERTNASEIYVNNLARLLDDNFHPVDSDFDGRRSRMCEMLVQLDDAHDAGLIQVNVIRDAAERLQMNEFEAKILSESLVEAYRTATSMGLLSDTSREDMELGILPDITAGPYAGGEVDFEYVVPVAQAPELEGLFANMALRPTVLTERFGVPVDAKSYARASHFYNAQVISQSSYLRVGERYSQGG